MLHAFYRRFFIVFGHISFDVIRLNNNNKCIRKLRKVCALIKIYRNCKHSLNNKHEANHWLENKWNKCANWVCTKTEAEAICDWVVHLQYSYNKRQNAENGMKYLAQMIILILVRSVGTFFVIIHCILHSVHIHPTSQLASQMKPWFEEMFSRIMVISKHLMFFYFLERNPKNFEILKLSIYFCSRNEHNTIPKNIP